MTILEQRVLIACQELIKEEIFPGDKLIVQKLKAHNYFTVYLGRIRSRLIRDGNYAT